MFDCGKKIFVFWRDSKIDKIAENGEFLLGSEGFLILFEEFW